MLLSSRTGCRHQTVIKELRTNWVSRFIKKNENSPTLVLSLNPIKSPKGTTLNEIIYLFVLYSYLRETGMHSSPSQWVIDPCHSGPCSVRHATKIIHHVNSVLMQQTCSFSGFGGEKTNPVINDHHMNLILQRQRN
jgi:hypothetical protein